jgi:hypothetical protein
VSSVRQTRSKVRVVQLKGRHSETVGHPVSALDSGSHICDLLPAVTLAQGQQKAPALERVRGLRKRLVNAAKCRRCYR